MKDVWKFINNLNITKEEPLVIACSGGPDSMFLLNILHQLGFNCICAHVNHNVREVSKEEYEFLRKYCLKNDIIFEGTEITCYGDDNFHNEAREFRYKFFQNLITKYGARYLFTAHHGDDLIETILMRIVRGSTLKGYAGFSSIVEKDSYKIVRPLIYISKEEIENYDKENDIEYVVDESNAEDHYTRNRYRHKVLPFLKNEESNVHSKFLDFSHTLLAYAEFIDNLVDTNYNEVFYEGRLSIDKLINLDLVIQKEIISKMLSENYADDLFLINDHHVEEILNMVNSSKPNIVFSLPNNKKIIKSYNELTLVDEFDEKENYSYEFDSEIKTPLGIIKKVDESQDYTNYTIRLNSQNIKLPLIIRTRLDGDKMWVKNMNGSKKINDIFIDSKIELSKRNVWPIITDSNGIILWVPGLKKSKFDIPKEEVYDIILKYEKGEMSNDQKN